ncbi:MAG: ribosomal RNA small subunit methyltransferase E [Nitrospirales bacterium]|nr:MAG: ribosomal RNA small subunit methyltransferase E [Nitrospirales bacterium]
MPVFFVSSTTIQHHRILLTGSLYTHIVKSLRVRPGQSIQVCDEQRQRHSVEVIDISKQTLCGHIQDTVIGPPQEHPTITLAQSVLKGDHMAWVIQKSTELGVHTIVPIISERVQSRSGNSSMISLHQRWQRIALEAAQQSERWDFPTILEPQPFHTFLLTLSETQNNLILVEREEPAVPNTATEHNQQFSKNQNVVLTIGPEGGWSQAEIQDAENSGMRKVTLGKKILRSETAAIAGIVMIQERFQHMRFTTMDTKGPSSS